MLRWRILTAAILGPAFVAAIWLFPPAPLAVLFAVTVALGGWEWARLVGLSSAGAVAFLAGLFLCMAAGWWYLGAGLPLLPLFVASMIWWLVAIAWLGRFSRGEARPPSKGVAVATGYLVLWPAWFALIYLRTLPEGPLWIVGLCLLVWGADIGAYFAGRFLGRRKLAPTISPNKTWEGAIGGVALALLLGAAFYPLLLPQVPAPSLLLPLALLTIAVSVVGDLFESMIKRLYGAKDSGTLLPGHGGVLDRVDSITAAAPVFALGILLWQLSG